MKSKKYHFCMSQFKPAIAGLTVFCVLVVGWAAWNCKVGRHQHFGSGLGLAATKATASPIRANDKMTHAYWGNCNMCHLTSDVPQKPVSKVFAGAPIPVKAPMTHEYWGNCNLCHKVDGGIAPQYAKTGARVAAANPAPQPITRNAKATHPDWGVCTNCHKIVSAPAGRVAAFGAASSTGLGMETRTVTGALMRQFGLANEDGVLVQKVTPGSAADRAGIKDGDEIIRAGKTRVETAAAFERALSGLKPGGRLKLNLYRGNKSRNLYIALPLPQKNRAAVRSAPTVNAPRADAATGLKPRVAVNAAPAANRQPLTNNRIETLAERFGVPKTRSAVENALNSKGKTVDFGNSGKVAVAVVGPNPGDRISTRFGENPYFIIFDPLQGSYTSVVNPNFNDRTGRDVQSAHHLVDMGVQNIIAGDFTPGAIKALNILGVNIFQGVTGTAEEAVLLYNGERLTPYRAPIHAARPVYSPIRQF